MNFIRAITATAFAATAVFSIVHAAQADDQLVDRLFYFNNGGYTVSNVQVYWIDANTNEKKVKEYGKNMTLGQGFCFYVDGYNKNQKAAADKIPEGSEIWIEVKIAGGGKKSCRKDRKIVYKKDSDSNVWWRTDGTTHNNNRCIKRKSPTTNVVSGQRGNCSYKIYRGD